jgi:The GLUG motif
MEATSTISNAHELQLVATNAAGSYTLANNIDLAPSLANHSDMWKDTTGGGTFHGSFVPLPVIGAFTGKFDGLGFVIDNLYINRSSSDNNGLFFGIQGATIQNIGLTNINITGAKYTAGLVGNILTSSVVLNSYTTGIVSGTTNSGGLVGYARGSITNSYSTATVTGTVDVTGGLVGRNDATISNSYATGTVSGATHVGGLVGYNDVGYNPGTINSSYATGDVSGTNYIGGLAGTNGSSGTVNNSYATGSVTGTGTGLAIGGLLGSNSHTVSSSHATGSVNGNNKVGGLIGDNAGGTLSDVYASGAVTSTGSIAGGLVGNNVASISNAYATGTVHGTDRVGGFVGYNSGNISNSYSTGNVSGSSDYNGGFVGQNFSGSILRSYSTGNVSGGGIGVGGFVGDNSEGGAISDSYATGNVQGLVSSVGVGGFVGMNDDPSTGSRPTISNSYSTGSVTTLDTGVNGTNYYIGGFAGLANVNDITNSVYNSSTSGVNVGYSDLSSYTIGSASVSGKILGKTTAEMKDISLFNGTTPAWDIVSDSSLSNVYPQLRWATNGLGAGTSIWAIGKGQVTYSVTGGTKSYGQAFTLPTPTFTGGTPTGSATVKVYDAQNNDVTAAATAGTLGAGTYSVKALLTDSNYQIANSGNTEGVLTIAPAPTVAPTPAPTAEPTAAPTSAPTVAPSISSSTQQQENKRIEDVISKIADTVSKVADIKPTNEIKQVVENAIKEVKQQQQNTQNTTTGTASKVQVIVDNKVADGAIAQGGGIDMSGGKTSVTATMISSANPFSGNDRIVVLDGGVKVASVELPASTAVMPVATDIKPAGIIDAPTTIAPSQQTASTQAPVASVAPAVQPVVKLASQKGVELTMMTSPSSNAGSGAGAVTAKVDLTTTGNFSFTVKEAVVIKTPPADIQSVQATTATGQTLPSWLKFDSTTQTFSAVNPPANALPISTTITVTDKAGQIQQLNVDITK